MAGHTLPFGDFIQPFEVETLGVRGRLARLGPALKAAIAAHGYPGAVNALLAETVTLAAALASTLKFDGVFTLQTQGDGPVGVLLADVTSKGGFRAYARVDAERLARLAADPGASVPRLLGAGYLAFTVDQGPETDRYQGITELTGATLAECAQAYFRQSEQLATAIASAAMEPVNGDGARAAALLIQRLPSAGRSGDAADGGDDDWRRAVALTSSITSGELLDPALPATEILYRLYHQEGVRVYRTKPLFHACRCSREKVMVTLGSFPEADIRDMAEDGRLTVTCEFCKADYHFDESDIAKLFEHRAPTLDRRRASF